MQLAGKSPLTMRVFTRINLAMSSIQKFLEIVDAFRLARDLSDGRVSTLVFNDGSKIKLLRSGRDIGVQTMERAVRWFSDNWPETAIWPDCIVRPADGGPLGHSDADIGASSLVAEKEETTNEASNVVSAGTETVHAHR